MSRDPHRECALLRAGPTAASASLAVLALHGRGGSAEQMVSLIEGLGLPALAVFAPQAAQHSWWPMSFLASFDALEPWLTSALAAVDRALATIHDEGFGSQRVVLLGFSQGGCLALEATARRSAPLNALVGLSSALIGFEEAPDLPPVNGFPNKRLNYQGRLDGLPIYLSCHDDDPHIPLMRLRDSEAALRAMGGRVELRLKRGATHGIDDRDIAALRALLNRPAGGSPP